VFLSKRSVVVFTCIMVLGWTVLDLALERSRSPRGGEGFVVRDGVDVRGSFEGAGFATVDLAASASIVARVLPPEDRRALQGFALLREGDRQGAVYWVRTGGASQAWQQLKPMLHPSLSPLSEGIRDETLGGSSRTIEIFAFTDRELSDERFLFTRRGPLLLEAHLALGTAEEIERFIEELMNS